MVRRALPWLVATVVVLAACAAPAGDGGEAIATTTTVGTGGSPAPTTEAATDDRSDAPTRESTTSGTAVDDANEEEPVTNEGSAEASEGTVAPTDDGHRVEELPSEPPTGVVEPGLDPLIGQAKADLADRLGIPVDDIETVSAEAVVWPDGSLGCPQPGMEYTQVLVDGAKIVLYAQDKTWEYHSGGTRAPFLCVTPG